MTVADGARGMGSVKEKPAGAAADRPRRTAGDRSRPARTTALCGIAAVVVALAASRWGAYLRLSIPPWPGGLGFQGGPPYLSDALIAGALVVSVCRTAARPFATRLTVPLSVALGLWAFLRLSLGSQFDMLALRDAAPYFYAFLVPIAARSARSAGEQSLRRTQTILVGAMCAHLAWALPALISPTIFSAAPFVNGEPPIRLFEFRTDFDSMVLAVLAVVSIRRALMEASRPTWHWLTAAVATAAVMALHSRVGLLVLMLGALTIAIQARSSRRVSMTLALALPVALIAVFVVLPNTVAGRRLLMEDQGLQSAQAGAQASGTTRARAQSWADLTKYTYQQNGSLFFGAGFGVDVLRESGAKLALVGSSDADVRSPHNYLVGSFARLGLVGLVLLLFLVGSAAADARRAMRSDDTGLARTLTFLASATLVAALVGVILESPFGAIPFFWSVGALAGLAQKEPASA